VAANNDPNCEWSWLNERHPSTDVTPEDNGPPDDEPEDDMPLVSAVAQAIWVSRIDAAYNELMLLHGQKPRSL
jgi:hypothetical protein